MKNKTKKKNVGKDKGIEMIVLELKKVRPIACSRVLGEVKRKNVVSCTWLVLRGPRQQYYNKNNVLHEPSKKLF
jgi:hypothetical protein